MRCFNAFGIVFRQMLQSVACLRSTAKDILQCFDSSFVDMVRQQEVESPYQLPLPNFVPLQTNFNAYFVQEGFEKDDDAEKKKKMPQVVPRMLISLDLPPENENAMPTEKKLNKIITKKLQKKTPRAYTLSAQESRRRFYNDHAQLDQGRQLCTLCGTYRTGKSSAHRRSHNI